MKLFYSHDYAKSKFAFETTRKSQWIARSLRREPIPGVKLVAPAPLTAEDFGRVHDAKYVKAVRTGKPRLLAESQGFKWDRNLWDMVCATNGGAVAAAVDALDSGVAGSLSSGLHHARRAEGGVFCTFNGLALAAKAALDAGAGNVLILDLDAHCGGGTHELVHADERIWHMDISTNNFDSYKPKGNSQLAVVKSDARYLPTIQRKLEWLEKHAPRFDLCIYNAGMDPLSKGITHNVLWTRENMVFEWCRSRNIPVAFVLAGGYLGRTDKAGLVGLHRLTIEAATTCNPPALHYIRNEGRPSRTPQPEKV